MSTELITLIVGASIGFALSLLSGIVIQVIIYNLQIKRERRNQRKMVLLERIKIVEDSATDVIKSIISLCEIFAFLGDDDYFRKIEELRYKTMKMKVDYISGSAAADLLGNEKVSSLLEQVNDAYVQLLSIVLPTVTKKYFEEFDRGISRTIVYAMVSKELESLDLRKMFREQVRPSKDEIRSMLDEFREKNKEKIDRAYVCYAELIAELDNLKSEL